MIYPLYYLEESIILIPITVFNITQYNYVLHQYDWLLAYYESTIKVLFIVK